MSGNWPGFPAPVVNPSRPLPGPMRQAKIPEWIVAQSGTGVLIRNIFLLRAFFSRLNLH